jgi:aminopeptidase N
VRTAAAAVAAVLVVTGCTSDADQPEPSPSAAPAPSPATVARGDSDPVEDSVYPDVGDPGVDALSYDLDLTWDKTTLVGRETLRLRATEDADHLQLDLSDALTVREVLVDGAAADFDHEGKDLVVSTPVTADRRYELRIDYDGTPEPTPAPTERRDFDATGWTTTPDGEVWTMQEPYGAFTWYAVNDQPSDKALYSFTVTAPAPWVAVANGELRSQRTVGDTTVSRWELDEPASSYLVTIAIGDFVRHRYRAESGTPVTTWTPRDEPRLAKRMKYARVALDWMEYRLGPYPFDSLGVVVVDSMSGMETQTMITLGDTPYATGPEVLVHEIAHQWYGDQVSPRDWADVWMNEGMATYLQAWWTSQVGWEELDEAVKRWSDADAGLRERYGPPADYDPDAFGAPNVYTSAALMWHRLRLRLGDNRFWHLAAGWPASRDNGNADYDDITSWWSEESGQDLTDFFHDWLLGETTPELS